MDCKKGGTTGTAGVVKDTGIPCYYCVKVSHSSHNCPNCDSIIILLQQVFVSKNAPKVRPEWVYKDLKMEGAPSG